MPSPVTLCGSMSCFAGPLGRTLHEAGYRALGLPFVYVPFEVAPHALDGAIAGVRALGIRGLGVSQPFKERVIPLLDELDPVARRIGAVNTVVHEEGRLVGHNTDWSGAVRALEEERSLEQAGVLLLGAGGAARAIAFGLRERGARITIANRDEERGAKLAADVGARAAPLAEVEAAADYDVVVNATSVGQAVQGGRDGSDGRSTASLVPERALRAGQVVLDLVYKPTDTLLLGAARRRGARPVSGARMLLHQAAAQFTLYTGAPAPLSAMEEALRNALARR